MGQFYNDFNTLYKKLAVIEGLAYECWGDTYLSSSTCTLQIQIMNEWVYLFCIRCKKQTKSHQHAFDNHCAIIYT